MVYDVVYIHVHVGLFSFSTPGAGRLGAGACASEILGVGQSSNVNAITGTHYFHQSNFYFRQHHFHLEKIYLLRINICIDPASISVKEGLFSSKQHTLRK